MTKTQIEILRTEDGCGYTDVFYRANHAPSPLNMVFRYFGYTPLTPSHNEIQLHFSFDLHMEGHRLDEYHFRWVKVVRWPELWTEDGPPTSTVELALAAFRNSFFEDPNEVTFVDSRQLPMPVYETVDTVLAALDVAVPAHSVNCDCGKQLNSSDRRGDLIVCWWCERQHPVKV